MRVPGSRSAALAAVVFAVGAGAGWEWVFANYDDHVVGWAHLWIGCTVAATGAMFVFLIWAMADEDEKILTSKENSLREKLEDVQRRRERLKASS